MCSTNPLVVELTRPDLLTNSEKQLKLLGCAKNQIDNNLLELSEIISPLVKLVASNNSSVKSSVCDLIIQASAQEPDIGLLVVNILSKDVSDPNPSVRSTAISTICCLPILLPHVQVAVQAGLQDSNSCVRVSAVTGIGKVWRHSPGAYRDLGLTDKLYGMLRDHDSNVVTFTLQTLNIILADEGGVRVNKKMARYLLSKVVNYREKEFCFVVDFLHIPDIDTELTLEILNTLDSFLDHNDGNVMLSVASLFMKLVSSNKSLQSSLVKRIVPVFVRYLTTNSQREFNYFLLILIQDIEECYIDALRSNFKIFFTKPKESEKLKILKIKFLPRLVIEDNSMEILNFLLNLLPQSSSINYQIFKSISIIVTQETSCYQHGIINLEMLLKTDCDAYISDILLTAEYFHLKEHSGDDEGQRINQFVATLTTLLSYHPKIAATPSHVSAMLSLLSDFCGHIPDPSHILQNILESDRAEWKPSLYCQLLSCCFDVFQIHPPAMQLIMGQVLQETLVKDDQLLQETAMFYYNLLKTIKSEVNR